MIKVKKGNRFGHSPGCWWISVKQAKKLLDGKLPRLGYDKDITPKGNPKWSVYVSNLAGRMRLHDERRLLNVQET